ncbi:protein CASC3-like [Dendrobates tinctorius]|uniref:protein CASC3-like n=1 Tax=Dendrobates tinctorius TaxID=92724 RepID=UPI003CC9783C
MLSKRQIACLKNLQPAAPRRQAAPYYKTKEEFAEGCYVHYINNDSMKMLMKVEYNSKEAPSMEEQNYRTVQGTTIMELHQIGDGQEIPVQKKKKRKKKQPRRKKQQQVADDQDRNNPACVPWNKDYFSHFYHDLRWTNDTIPRSEKHHIEVQGRWKHDKFCLKDQAPKSAEELIATYGFDIRARKNP